LADKEHIPCLRFEWYYPTNGDLQPWLEAEVINTDSGKLESLNYDDKAYWNSRPPIDVPISLGKNESPYTVHSQSGGGKVQLEVK